jgi:hypothetical protein
LEKLVKLAVLGSGRVGSALGGWLASQGVSVTFTSRTLSKAVAAAESAGHDANHAEIAEAAQASDVVLLTLPFAEVITALEPLRDLLAGKIMVDVTNPITPDHRALSIGHTSSGAEEIARNFPTTKIVKAFNATFAEVYTARISGLDGRPLTIFYAGDDFEAKRIVCGLITTLGYDAVDAGPLENSRYLEPLSLLNIQLGRVLGFGSQIGFSLVRLQQ